MPGSTVHRVSPASLTHVDVILGSLTTTSEEFAYSLVAKAEQQGAEVTFQSLDNFNPDHLVGPTSPYRSPSRVLVFVLSTHMAGKPASTAEAFLLWLQQSPEAISSYGHSQSAIRESEVEPSIEACARTGSTPDAATRPPSPRKNRTSSVPKPAIELHPHQLLRPAPRPSIIHLNWRHPFGGAETKLDDGPLSGVQYAVFGVGNSIYRTYNATAKYVDARLHELGALRVFPLGLGDAAKWIDVTFSKWEKQLIQLVAGSRSSVSLEDGTEAEVLPVPEANSSHQDVALGPTSADVSNGAVALQRLKKSSLTRSYSIARILMRRRSTLEPSSPVVMPAL